MCRCLLIIGKVRKARRHEGAQGVQLSRLIKGISVLAGMELNFEGLEMQK